MKITLEQAEKMVQENGGYLDLRNTQITELPEGLTVGGSLYLSGTQITELPEGLTVGGSLYLSGTQITELPEGLTVGGWLDLRNTQITELPEGLTVGGDLYLSGTQITELPEGLTVGGYLYLSNTQIKQRKCKRLKNGDYVPGKYLYADNILTHIKKKKTVGEYTLFIGKIPGQNVVFDGENYAHCRTLREGIADLLFKSAKDRGVDQYLGISLDDSFTVEELKTMYRVITGACKAGTESFVSSLRNLKEKYTIREAIEMTDGQYNAEKFKEFFEGENE